MKLERRVATAFGDSFTTGENNEHKGLGHYLAPEFAYLNQCATSGTAMGEYSIYPVNGKSLLSTLNGSLALVKEADIIILEYGINDATALMLGNTDIRKILVTIAKVDDFIKQTNPNAKVVFLKLSDNKQFMKDYAYLQQRYLADDYMKHLLSRYEMDFWDKSYDMIMKAVEKRFKTLTMIQDPSFLLTKLDKDKIHPTDEGYREIAKNIIRQLEEI